MPLQWSSLFQESQSNGSEENEVNIFKGLLRVHLIALDKKIGHKVPAKQHVMA